MKKCPYCAEDIQDEAIKCKHCGSELTIPPTPIPPTLPPPPAPIAEAPPVTPKKKTSLLAKGCLVLFVLFAVFLIVPHICGPSRRSSPSETKKNPSTNTAPECSSRSAETKLIDANDLRDKGLFDLAKRNYNELIQCHPNTPEAQASKNILGQWNENVKKAKQAKQQAEEKAKQKADKAFWQSKAGKICKSHPEWSREDCQSLADRKIWIGMSYDMLVSSRGKPDHVNTSNYGSGAEYQCCWDDYTPSCFYFNGSDMLVKSYN